MKKTALYCTFISALLQYKRTIGFRLFIPFLLVVISQVGFAQTTGVSRVVEIGTDDENTTTTLLQVHGGAIFNNDKDQTRVTKIAINTNRYADSAALTVAGPTYIGTWKSYESSRKRDYLSKYMLWVEKGIVTEDISYASKSDWADYVFDKKYKLIDLKGLENYIQENKHLPGIVTSEEVNSKGYSNHEFNRNILAKVEELTLYIIDQQKQIGALHQKIKDLSKR